MDVGLHSGRVLILSTSTADTPVMKSSVTRLSPWKRVSDRTVMVIDHDNLVVKWDRGTHGKSSGHGHVIQQCLVQPLTRSSLFESSQSDSHARRTLGVQCRLLLLGPRSNIFRKTFILLALFQSLVHFCQARFAECCIKESSNLAGDGCRAVRIRFGVGLAASWGGRSVRCDECRDVSGGWRRVLGDFAYDFRNR